MFAYEFLLLTVARISDRAGCRKVKLDESVLAQTNVSSDGISCVGFLNESESWSVRTTHRHSGSTRVEEPRPSVDRGEIIFQWPPAASTASHHNLKYKRENVTDGRDRRV